MLSVETLISALQKAGVNCSLVGGYAVALHGVVRGTVDIDLVLEHSKETFENCELVLRSLGLVPRLPVSAGEIYEFRQEYIANRNLIAWSFVDPKRSMTVVDIVLTHDLKTMKSVSMKFGAYKLPVISMDDLISMKRKSGRPQDLEDVEALIKLKEKKNGQE